MKNDDEEDDNDIHEHGYDGEVVVIVIGGIVGWMFFFLWICNIMI